MLPLYLVLGGKASYRYHIFFNIVAVKEVPILGEIVRLATLVGKPPIIKAHIKAARIYLIGSIVCKYRYSCFTFGRNTDILYLYTFSLNTVDINKLSTFNIPTYMSSTIFSMSKQQSLAATTSYCRFTTDPLAARV